MYRYSKKVVWIKQAVLGRLEIMNLYLRERTDTFRLERA